MGKGILGYGVFDSRVLLTWSCWLMVCSSGDSTARIWTIPEGRSGNMSHVAAPKPLVLKHFKGKTNEKSKDVTTLDWNVSWTMFLSILFSCQISLSYQFLLVPLSSFARFCFGLELGVPVCFVAFCLFQKWTFLQGETRFPLSKNCICMSTGRGITSCNRLLWWSSSHLE